MFSVTPAATTSATAYGRVSYPVAKRRATCPGGAPSPATPSPPLGPFIATDLNPGNLHLTARVNGRVVQESSTSDLIHDVASIIEFVTQVVTLEPGDVIMTGTPGRPVDISPGDTVEIGIDGIGVLSNPVAAE